MEYSICLGKEKIRKIISFLLLKLGCGQSEWLCLNSFVLILYLSFILLCFLKGRFQINSQCFNWRFLGQKISLYYYNFLWFNSWDNKNFSLMKCQFCYGDPWGCLRTFTWNFFSTWTPSVPVLGGRGRALLHHWHLWLCHLFLWSWGRIPLNCPGESQGTWAERTTDGTEGMPRGGDMPSHWPPILPIGVTSHTSAGTRPFLKCERLDCI